MKVLIIAVCALSITACSSKGFKREFHIEKTVVVPRPSKDADIQIALDKKPNLPKNMRIAVYFVEPEIKQRRYRTKASEWRWTQDDKAMISDIENHLKEKGLDAYVFPITSGLVDIQRRPEKNLKTIRLLAAKHGADAVLIIQGQSQVERTVNNLSISYLLVLPALFVPGSEASTLFIASASLWDVRNEYLYLTAESETENKVSYIPAFGPSNEEEIAKAKKGALEKLKDQIHGLIIDQQSKPKNISQK